MRGFKQTCIRGSAKAKKHGTHEYKMHKSTCKLNHACFTELGLGKQALQLATCKAGGCPWQWKMIIVCSQEVQCKSKLMFELYRLHLPNMCRHRQIKQPAFGLASSLFLIWCLCDFLCTCLIQKEWISIISAQLRYWQIKAKHSPTSHTQTRSQHHEHLGFPLFHWALSLLPGGQQIQWLFCTHKEFRTYTEHFSRIYRPYRETNFTFRFKSVLDLAGLIVVFCYFFFIFAHAIY